MVSETIVRSKFSFFFLFFSRVSLRVELSKGGTGLKGSP